MALAQQVWQQTTIHEVVAEFLLSERVKYARLPANLLAQVDTPNTANPAENHFRLRLLNYMRLQIMVEIPPDTTWYEVRSLTDAELPELLVIAHCGWDDDLGRDRNELSAVARRRPQAVRDPVAQWRRPILWGHDRTGPFTILEGNNRLSAYASAPQPPLTVPVFVGISPTPCFFHFPDPPHMLGNYLLANPFPQFRG